MGYFTRKKIKQMIEDPDAFWTINPKFCEHEFVEHYNTKLQRTVYVCKKCNGLLIAGT